MPGTRRKASGEDADSIARQFDAGEKVWSDRDQILDIEVKKPLDKVIPVRLTSETWTRLRREATELGVGPTTLARMWILERLRNSASRRGSRSGAATSKRRSA